MSNSVEPERHCRRNTLDIARIPPYEDWIKINCDGTVVQYGLKAVCGSVIRVTNGKFVLGFSRNLGTCFITFIELWAIYRGLQLAKNRGSPKIWIESDSLSVINLIEGCCPISYPCHGLVVNDIKKIAAQVTSIKLSHTF
jgi:ribonuclease HI